MATLPGEECPFIMCNGLTCAKEYGHQGMHHAIHRTIPGVESLDVNLWWDDMWCDPGLQKFTERMILQLPTEDGQA